MVFTFGKIPRGKGKAPGAVKPAGIINQATLLDHLEKTRIKVMEIEKMGSGAMTRYINIVI